MPDELTPLQERVSALEKQIEELKSKPLSTVTEAVPVATNFQSTAAVVD